MYFQKYQYTLGACFSMIVAMEILSLVWFLLQNIEAISRKKYAISYLWCNLINSDLTQSNYMLSLFHKEFLNQRHLISIAHALQNQYSAKRYSMMEIYLKYGERGVIYKPFLRTLFFVCSTSEYTCI